jgi:hypothetical protein
MFQRAAEESTNLRSQNVTSSSWGGRRTAPFAFTEDDLAVVQAHGRGERDDAPESALRVKRPPLMGSESELRYCVMAALATP